MLNALFLKRATTPGKYSDGGGLYLEVRREGNRSWIFRYSAGGRRREMGLGSLELVTLAQAREEAFKLRQLVAEGADPIERRRQAERDRALSVSASKTFGECVVEYVMNHRKGWTPKEAADFEATLRNHARALYEIPVREVSKSHIVPVLRAIWTTKTETAKRVRSRIERVLGYARIMGYREGENPAAWKDNLKHIFPAASKVAPVKHFRALGSAEMPAFMASLASLSGNPARVLEFKILTAVRSGEALGARWGEIDLAARTWRIPGDRMKARVPHRVPLSRQAMAILEFQASVRESEFVFAGNLRGRPLSEMAMIMVMRRMDAPATPHGFRSTFKDWATEIARVENVVSEMALAHTVADEVEAAYRRGDLFDRRRELMQSWADFILPPENSCGVPTPNDPA